ncbi:sodium channel protein Nach-like [Rhopalosiphum padi]|uniref:sodium channel protein Nach-like n=1 Tax=Rhopalosiphum padi TaxID=40932 RepID=UPI00298DD63F|nr:sodium channel protein Nach-like [Rhopalosiphum padi]
MILKEFADQSTIHGLHYVSNVKCHWTERLFWLICCILSWFGSALLMMNSWEAYQTNAISFVVETSSLEFQTTFPAVSVCEMNNVANIQKLANKIFGNNRNFNLDEIVKEITYFKGTSYYINEFCMTGQYNCPKNNFSKIAMSTRSTCDEVFLNCTWNDNREFDCCKHFVLTETELGICYTLTMENESPDSDDYINMYSNRGTGPSNLLIKLSSPSQVFIHSVVDVPYYNTISTDILPAMMGIFKQYKFVIKDIENEDEVKFVGITQRRCRFPLENELVVSSKYSYSSCIVDCRRRKQLEMCNCTSHLMPNSKANEQCDINGLICLNTHYAELSVLKKKKSKRPGLECHCVPSCIEAEINVITVESFITNENESIIQLMMDRLPAERLKRNVVRGRLDVLVSLGGSVALFVGASILSFLEIIYYFIIRMRNVKIPNLKRSKTSKLEFKIK